MQQYLRYCEYGDRSYQLIERDPEQRERVFIYFQVRAILSGQSLNETDVRNGLIPGSKPVHCRVSSWSHWSPCSVTCGIGHVTSYRTIEVSLDKHSMKCKRFVNLLSIIIIVVDVSDTFSKRHGTEGILARRSFSGDPGVSWRRASNFKKRNSTFNRIWIVLFNRISFKRRAVFFSFILLSFLCGKFLSGEQIVNTWRLYDV